MIRAYDPAGNTTNYTCDGTDRLTRITFATGTTTDYTYDDADRTTKIHKSRTDTTLELAYEAGDDLTKLTRPTACRGGGGGTVSYTYDYDVAGRLTRATYPDGAQSCACYDSQGLATQHRAPRSVQEMYGDRRADRVPRRGRSAEH